MTEVVEPEEEEVCIMIIKYGEHTHTATACCLAPCVLFCCLTLLIYYTILAYRSILEKCSVYGVTIFENAVTTVLVKCLYTLIILKYCE